MPSSVSAPVAPTDGTPLSRDRASVGTPSEDGESGPVSTGGALPQRRRDTPRSSLPPSRVDVRLGLSVSAKPRGLPQRRRDPPKIPVSVQCGVHQAQNTYLVFTEKLAVEKVGFATSGLPRRARRIFGKNERPMVMIS